MNTSLQQKRVLLTGGRAPVTLDLARQLAANGHLVFMAESCPDQLCRHSRSVVRNYVVPKANEDPDAYMHALEEIILSEEIDWLIPTCEELFFVSRGLGTLQKHCFTFVDSIERLRRWHSKWDFIGLAQELGFAVPATRLITTHVEAKAALSEPGKWVCKPVFSRFSARVFFVETAQRMKLDEIERTISEKMRTLSAENPWVVQQFMEGQAYCSYSIAKQGKLTAHAVYPVRFTAGQGACISFEVAHLPEIDRWVKRFVASENVTGQISFDFIVTASGEVYPIECNPRATSGIHLFREEDRLDQAFFQDEERFMGRMIVPQPNHRAMISLAMLSYGLLSIRSWSRVKEWLRLFVGGQDVVFRFRDSQPFFQQFRLLWWNVKASRQKRISILEATTHDIEWNGRE